jgi:hypothetical protein
MPAITFGFSIPISQPFVFRAPFDVPAFAGKISGGRSREPSDSVTLEDVSTPVLCHCLCLCFLGHIEGYIEAR